MNTHVSGSSARHPQGITADGGAIDPVLFRRQALDAATSRYGAPIRPTGLTGWALTGFLAALFVCVVIFLFIGRYTRKETVTGILQPTSGAARVIAMSAGVIGDVYVVDGQMVKAGDPILELSTDRSVARGGETPAALSGLMEEGARREAQAMMVQARAVSDANARALDDLRARRRALEEDQTQLADNMRMQEERILLAQQTVDAGLVLHARQLFSTLQLRQRQEALIAARQSLSSIQREVRRNRAALQQAHAEEGKLKAQSDQAAAEVSLARAQFDQRQAQRQAERATVLVAGKAGRVVALQARPGAPVQPGRALAIILPPGAKLQAELWVPSRAVGFIEAGDRVRLMYDAFPYQKFGVGRGTVASIAGAPTDPGDLAVPMDAKEALYRVLVTVDSGTVGGYGREWRLTPGMRLSADLVFDDRTLWEWLFDPIIAARRRVAG